MIVDSRRLSGRYDYVGMYVMLLLMPCPRSSCVVSDISDNDSQIVKGRRELTNAEKSALPVTALEASRDSFVDHTAPLCPDISTFPLPTSCMRRGRTEESPNPIPNPAPQHWIPIFTSRYQMISPVVKAVISYLQFRFDEWKMELTYLRIVNVQQALYGLNIVKVEPLREHLQESELV